MILGICKFTLEEPNTTVKACDEFSNVGSSHMSSVRCSDILIKPLLTKTLVHSIGRY